MGPGMRDMARWKKIVLAIDDALDLFQLEADLYPKATNSFDSLGDAYRKAGDTKKAADAYRRSLELDPSFEHSRRMLSELTSG